MVCSVLFGCIWYRLVALQNSVQNRLKWCQSSCLEVVWKFLQQTIRSTPLDSNLMFRCVLYYLGAFGTVCCVTSLSSKQAKQVPVRATMSRRNFSQRTCPIHPIGLLTHVLVCFVLFGCIWDYLVALQNSVQNGPNWCKSSCHEVMP
jgi:hypothetical protein